MIGNASGAGRGVSPFSHATVHCQKHFDGRSILTLKHFKFYKHFSDYWIINNWSQLFLSHKQRCIGSPSSPMIIFLYRVVGCERQVCGSRGLLQSESGRRWHMCTCMSFIYRLLSSLLSFAFWLFFRRFPSIAAIDSFTARSHVEWSTAWSFQDGSCALFHVSFEHIF